MDVLSIVLSSVGFGGLLYGFTAAGNYGWTDESTIISLGIGTISLVWFIKRQLRLKHPMLEFRVFTYSLFPLAIIIGAITFMGLIGAETLIPLFMQNMRGFTAFEAGLAILPGALITGIMSPFIGRIFDRIGARWLVIGGLLLITSFLLYFYRCGSFDKFYIYYGYVQYTNVRISHGYDACFNGRLKPAA